MRDRWALKGEKGTSCCRMNDVVGLYPRKSSSGSGQRRHTQKRARMSHDGGKRKELSSCKTTSTMTFHWLTWCVVCLHSRDFAIVRFVTWKQLTLPKVRRSHWKILLDGFLIVFAVLNWETITQFDCKWGPRRPFCFPFNKQKPAISSLKVFERVQSARWAWAN